MTDKPLTAIVDGRPLPETEARALWTRFSSYMDAHQGDFDGFARQEGYAQARVEVIRGAPTLELSKEPTATPAPKQGKKKRSRGGRRRKRRKKDGG